ncbi:hypothetical protein, partial [Enterococcus avium]|uniref:hypothetical protein n=1 Tax=Enterococcus avium TaxID=33945 RepID=UPI0039A65AF0
HLYHSRMGFFFHHLRGETKKVIIRLPLGSFRRFQLKSMNYSGWIFAIQKCMDFPEAFVAAREDEQLKYFYRLIDQNEEMSLYVHEELGLDC